MTRTVYALVVGIDYYTNAAEAPHLCGAVADAEAIAHLLTSRFDMADERLLLLTSRMDQSEPPERRATRANILAGWQDHLAKAGAGDQIFFHYSGHGSRARSLDPTEGDGYDETLVPCDSRTPGIYDIIDKELAALIESAERRGAQVTAALDCCHSGSGTRALDDERRPRVRRCQPDNRQRPPATVLLPARARPGTRATRSPSGWTPLGNHLLLAACRDEELSHEYQAPESGGWHGAATYFLLKALNTAQPGQSWADVYDLVQSGVHALYPSQSPQLEGPGDLEIFGGLGRSTGGYLLVQEVLEQSVRISGGAAVGLAPGSRLAIYPPASPAEGPAHATATIEEVKVDHAWAIVDGEVAVEPAGRVKVLAYGYAEQTHIVAVDDEEVRRALAGLANGQPSPFLRPVALNPALVDAPDSSGAAPEFYVLVEDGRYLIQDAAGVQLVDETPVQGAEGAGRVAANLEHLAIYRNVLRLHNPSPTAALAGCLQIGQPVIGQLDRQRRLTGPSTPVRQAGNELVIISGQENLSFTIANRCDRPLYIAVFNLDSNYGIRRHYPPRAAHETLEPGREIRVPIPGIDLTNARLAQGRESFKIFATTYPTSFNVLALPELNQGDVRAGTRTRDTTPLGALLQGVRRSGTRPARPIDVDDTDDQWITAQFDFTVLASAQQQELPPNVTKVVLDATRGLALHKPASFIGSVSMGGANQSTRGAGAPDAPLPPGLADPEAAAWFRPVTLGEGVRAAGESPLLIEVVADAGQLAAIGPQNPLRVELALEDEPELAGIVPIAYDGDFYYVAGKPIAFAERTAGGPRRFAAFVNLLPAGTATTRDLRRTARLFLYKVFLRSLPADTGVRKAGLENGKAVYTPASRQDVAAAQRVVLMIHGINADTRSLVEKVWVWAQGNGTYDLCLTYDYESLGTGIQRNAELLAQTLSELGFGADDGIALDLICHSMGALTGRALVELYGGDAYVDRVLMGGPPNAGTPLAKGRTLAPWLGNVLLNLAGAVPPALLAHWLLDRLSAAGQGLADLDPDSRFYQELNHPLRPPAQTPYFVQTGNNASSTRDWKKFAQTLMKVIDSGLDVLFADEHDLAVGVESALALRHRWPNFTSEVIGVNHFQYFHSEEGQRVLARWLSL